jgi:hypothetical protein
MDTVISLLKDWRLAYQDNRSVIFVRAVPTTAPPLNH